MNTEAEAQPEDAGTARSAEPADNKDPTAALSEENIQADRKAWCEAYVHVWSDLSKGTFDTEAIEKAADEHWQHSPRSNPVVVATTEFTKKTTKPD